MTVVCAGCGSRVLPRSDGSCPACGSNIDPDAPPPTRRRMSIGEAEPLPSICVSCGLDTDRVVAVSSEKRVGGEHPVMLVLAALGMLMGGMMVARRGGAPADLLGRRQHFRRELPCCRSCGRLEPLHTDFETQRIEVMAHRVFDEGLQRLRKGEGPRPVVPDRYR